MWRIRKRGCYRVCSVCCKLKVIKIVEDQWKTDVNYLLVSRNSEDFFFFLSKMRGLVSLITGIRGSTKCLWLYVRHGNKWKIISFNCILLNPSYCGEMDLCLNCRSLWVLRQYSYEIYIYTLECPSASTETSAKNPDNFLYVKTLHPGGG